MMVRRKRPRPPPFKELTYWFPRLHEPEVFDDVTRTLAAGVANLAVGSDGPWIEAVWALDLFQLAAERRKLDIEEMLLCRQCIVSAAAGRIPGVPIETVRENLSLQYAKVLPIIRELKMRMGSGTIPPLRMGSGTIPCIARARKQYAEVLTRWPGISRQKAYEKIRESGEDLPEYATWMRYLRARKGSALLLLVQSLAQSLSQDLLQVLLQT